MPVELQTISIRLPRHLVKTLDNLVAHHRSLNRRRKRPAWPYGRTRSDLIRHILLREHKYVAHLQQITLRKHTTCQPGPTPHPTISDAAATD